MAEPSTQEKTEAVKQVRALIADTDSKQLLTDEQIETYLVLNEWNVRRGAAEALEVIATSETLVSKVIRTQDLSTDGAKVADSLRKHAALLRRQADDLDPETAAYDGFDIVPTVDCGARRPEHTAPEVWGL